MKNLTLNLQFIIQYINGQANPFVGLHEFDFLNPLAAKVKTKGCYCGLGGETAERIKEFNEIAQNISPESIVTLKERLGLDKICFGIQTINNYITKCY